MAQTKQPIKIKTKASSFSVASRTGEVQSKIIVTLLSDAIKKERSITREDIMKAHTDYIFYTADFYFQRIPTYNGLQRKKVHKRFYTPNWSKAHQWFKSNLGAAIIKGKILAIPVIDF